MATHRAATTRRPPLTRNRIAEAALTVTAVDGLPALTLQRVADRLGVWPMALYHHVDGKDGLVRLVLQGVLDQLVIDADEADWQAWYRAFAVNSRELLLLYPGVADQLARHGNPSRDSLLMADRALDVLRRAGFDAETAAVAYVTIWTFVIARVQGEDADGNGRDATGRQRRFFTAVDELDEGEGARLHESVTAWRSLPPETYLTFGLEVILDGLERHRRP
jgi:AcrR family transcriptional regulator